MKAQQIKIISSGKYVPPQILTNEDLEKIVDTSDEWIVTRTGIKERRKVTFETASDLAYLAALNAINNANYDINKIDLIVVASVTSEQMTPSIANRVQARLGLNHEVMGFDVNAACTGFVYGLEIASSMLQMGRFRSALVIGSETLTKITDYTDRNTCVLFGDGAGAMIIEPTKEKSLKSFFFNAARGDTDGFLTVTDKIRMDGKRVYIFAIDAMESSINRVLKDAKLNIDDIDVIIPHQANERIIQAVSKSMGIPMEKFLLNLQNYGNTSAASIPITIAEYIEKFKMKHQKILLVGFGGGFTWGSAILQL
jgi:3-oxoacyl-[acyl-carrier-protein] synthase III